MTKYLQSLKGAKASQEGYNASLKATSIGSKAAAAGITFLNVALNSLVTMGVSLVIQGLVTWISKLATAQQDAIDTANEMAEAYKSTTDEISANIKSIESVEKEFEKLSRGVDEYGNNIALSADEYARYKEIVEQIVGISPSLITGYDKEGNAIANKNGLIERSIELMKEEQRLRLEEITSDEALKKLASGKIGEYNKYQQDNPMNTKDNRLADGVVVEFGNLLGSIQEKSSEYDDYDFFKLFGLSDKWNDFYGGTGRSKLPNLVTEYYEEISDMVINKRSELSKVLSQDDLDALEKLILKHNQNTATYESQLEQYAQKLNPSLQLVPQTLTAYQEMTDAQKKFIAQYVNGFRITADTTEKDVLEMSQSIKDFADLLANDDTAKQAINDFFALDKTALSASDWQSQANSLVDSVANALQLTDEEKLQLKVGLKIDNAKYNETIRGVQEKLKDEFDGRVGELSFADLEIAYGLKDVGEMTFDELIAKIEAFKASASTITTTLQPLNISLTDIADKTNTLATAWKEMDEAGEVSIATITKLIETDANWADSIEIVNGKVTINKDTIVGSAKSIITAKKQEALAVIESCEKQIEMLQLSAKASRESAQEFIKSASATALAAGMAGASGKMYFDEMNARANGNVAGVSNFDKEIANARKSVEIFDTMLSQLEGDDPFRTTTDSAKDAKDAINDLKQAMSSAQSAINSLLSMTMDMIKQKYADEKDEIEKLKDAEKDRYDTSKKALEDAYEQEKKTHDLQKQAIEDAKDGAKAVLDLKLKALQAEKDAYYWEKDLAKKNKSVADIEADLATIGNDDSEEGLAKERELQEELAKAKEELADAQFDHNQELQKKALNDEYDLFEEKQNNELDILDRDNQYKEELHQAELDRLESEYNKFVKAQDAKIEKIEEHTKYEANIRAEAIKLIEDKNSGLYGKLLYYNEKYGSGIREEVDVAWKNANKSLETFGGTQFSVLSVLGNLVTQMDAFEQSTQNAADAVRDLAQQTANVESPNANRNNNQAEINSLRQQLNAAYKQQQNMPLYGGNPSQIQSQIDYLLSQIKALENLNEYHSGGVVSKGNQKTDESLGLKPDETLAKLKVGETVLSPDAPKTARQLMTDFLNSDVSSTFSDFSANPISQQLINDAVPSPIIPTDFSKYERANITSTFDLKQGDIIIQGDASKATVMDVRKELNNAMSDLMRQVNRGLGGGRLKPL